MQTFKKPLWFSLATILVIMGALVFGMNLGREHNTDTESVENYMQCFEHPASCLLPLGGFESLRGM
ncbi:hypothetical protein [Phytohalomonas tamaricis]|uniref:hypothetical protein n=1 Tax=Phytohalomonas tamaricis TaxID=2081032 RepID=UPI000D0B1FDD|nr:hypothetical protein [Phytohalomonas tamaricis]